MAKVNLSKYIKSLRGKVGDFVFRHMPDGSTVVSIIPKKKRKSSKAQKAYRHGTFTDRTQWAKMAQHEYPIYAQLAAERPMITAYNLAIKDIAHPPVIHRILRKEGRILVNASDEIMVAGVKVTVHDEQGKLLEVGDAVQQGKDWWEYIPKVEGRISASAWDIPGNRVSLELE
jgi:hypothetical protein